MRNLRDKIIRLAHANPELRADLLPLLKEGKEFTNKKELEKYFKDHPDADKTKHKVVESEKGEGKKDDEKGEKGKLDPKDVPEETVEQIKEIKDSEIAPGELAELHREEMPEYNLVVIAGEDGNLTKKDIERAKDIHKRVKKGIEDAADFCDINPPVCEGNLGITRDNMPQIMDVPVKELLKSDKDRLKDMSDKDKAKWDKKSDEEKDKKKAKWTLERKKGQAAIDAGADPDSDKSQKDMWLDKLKSSGVEITEEKVPVGNLKASQAEIKAKKSYGMADAYLNGSFDKLPDLPILVSKDPDTGAYTVIDGHHRYAGLLAADPSKPMTVQVINAPIRDALGAAFDMPGTFRADIQDNMVSMDKPLDMARKSGDSWKQSNGKWYGKNKEEAGGPFENEEAAKNFAEGKKTKGEKKAMSLRSKIIRLAHEHPEFREDLLPLVKQADMDPEDIGREVGGPLDQVDDAGAEPWMKEEFTQQENRELSELQEAGALPGTQLSPRKPSPGKQADRLGELRAQRKLAQMDPAQRLAELRAQRASE